MEMDPLVAARLPGISQRISVTKSASDCRVYRALVLENRLKVLLISDPSTDKAAGSLTVGAGSLCNPAELPGLAHFCEHMVFLGTVKYPEENGFDKYLSDNGGASNAYTDEDHTNYHFDVSPEALKLALDRFAQFFVSPLFTESSTEREIHAVNSEHEQNTASDDWRSSDIQKHTSDSSHPYQRFATGNLDTLWIRPTEKNLNVMAALKDYHNKYYSANIMSLAVLGKESLDQLESIVDPLFSQIENKDVELPFWEESPFTENHVGVWIRVVPIKDIRQMSIVFPFPDTTKSYKSGSDHYLTHLIGHEGKGSLLSLLKKLSWVNELTTEIQAIGRGFGSLSIDLELTKDGLRHDAEIVAVVFQYLKMLNSVGPHQWVWDELRDMEAMNFRFKDSQNPESYTCDLTPKMLLYPLQDVLSAEHLISEYNPDEISRMLSFLIPEKCRVTILTKENESKVDMEEEFYKIKYSVEKIKPELIDKWKNCELNEELCLPSRNEFIPSLFELKPRDNTGITPRLIVNDAVSRAFYLQDNEFLLPKAVVRIEIFSPLPLKTAKNQVMIGLVKRTVEDSLSEFSYNASVAGLKYSILDTVYGLEIYVAGYDHKLGLLLEKVIHRLVNYSCEDKRFEVLKEAYLRHLKNWEREQPRKHADWYIGYLMRNKRWMQAELLEALKEVSNEELTSYVKQFMSCVKMEWLLYGNLTQSEAKALVSKCQQVLTDAGAQGLAKEQETRLREIKLKPGSDYVFHADQHTHSDSCATVLFQSGVDETRANVLIELMDQLAYESCYTQLRTKEQLGYSVWTNVRKANGTRGFQILVQSAYDSAYVDSRIDSYLEKLYETLQSMTEEEFLQHRNALAVRKAEKPKELGIRAEHLWSEILSRQLKFDRVNVELKELESITLKDALEFFEDLIGPRAEKRRRLSVQISSKAKKKRDKKVQKFDTTASKVIERNPSVIEDACKWKDCHEFFPATEFPDLTVKDSVQNGCEN